MQGSPNIPPIVSLPRDTTASDALLHDILDVLKENKAYELAVLEQQNKFHDSLDDLNRSLLINREERRTEVEEVSLQVEGLREDLNRLFVGPRHGARHGTGRRTPRRPRRVQTPRPMRGSPDPADSGSFGEDPLEDDNDPDPYRYSDAAVPIRASYTPAPTHPGIPSVTTGTTTLGSSRTRTPSNNLRPGPRQRSSSSELTYITDGPVRPSLPPGFVPYQDLSRHQSPVQTPRVPFDGSSLDHVPAPPPPQIQQHHSDRTSADGQSDW